MVQTGAARRAAVGTSANGLPTMVFDGTDVHLWPQSPAHSSTTKVGIWLWYKPATVSGTQLLYAVQAGVAGAANSRLAFYQTNDKLNIDVWKTSGSGRQFITASFLVAAAWHALYLQYDSSRGGDANVALYVGGVTKSLTPSGFGGAGAADLGELQAATGSATVGAANDSDTPPSAITNGGMLGPNILALNDNLTAAQIADTLLYEAPT
jgi:hypothetical protein